MVLRFMADGVENAANRERIADVANLLAGSCTDRPGGRLIAVENASQASDVYGRQPLRGTATLVLGHERRGVSRAMLAAAAEVVLIPAASRTVTTLNVAAAAAVAGWYVLHGSGPQARASRPARRRPSVLLSGDDHVEVGSSLRSAAAFGLSEVFLDDRGAGWFEGTHAQRREARAAARRHKNPLRVHRYPPGLAARFDEVIVIDPWQPGRALRHQPLARGCRQLVVIGMPPQELEATAAGRIRLAALDLRRAERAPLRVVASIALAEIARQAGRPSGAGPTRVPRHPPYGRDLKLVSDGDLLMLEPELLLSY
jgi:tRNA(Leu) C34 or U34 (ribose-2'-O)-methylase TrmL